MDKTEAIGYCEVCGIMDHHLVAGICPACQTKCKTYKIQEPSVIHADGQVNAAAHKHNDAITQTPYFLLKQAT